MISSNSFFRLKDPMEKLTKIKKIRVSVRAFLQDHKGNYVFLHHRGKDDYGCRNHYESFGGGVRFLEDFEVALRRELKEEGGYLIEQIKYRFSVVDEYARFEQVNIHHYYSAVIKEKTQATDVDQSLLTTIVSQPAEKWLEVFSRPVFGVNALVHQREYLMLKAFLNQLEM